MADEQVNHLCESCQCKCKQTTTVEVIMCPRYAASSARSSTQRAARPRPSQRPPQSSGAFGPLALGVEPEIAAVGTKKERMSREMRPLAGILCQRPHFSAWV